MYNCISVFLIATMVMRLTLENLFVFFFFLSLLSSHVRGIDTRKFLSMSMILSDNGRLMMVRSTRFEVIGFSFFNNPIFLTWPGIQSFDRGFVSFFAFFKIFAFFPKQVYSRVILLSIFASLYSLVIYQPFAINHSHLPSVEKGTFVSTSTQLLPKIILSITSPP